MSFDFKLNYRVLEMLSIFILISLIDQLLMLLVELSQKI